MKKIKIVKEVGVDSGSVMALLRAQATDNCIELAPGIYKIKLSVKDSWQGKNDSENFLEVKRHRFLCLADGFNKDDLGEKFFDSHEMYKKGCVLSTGGDGSFKVTVEITPVKKLGADPYKELLTKAQAFYRTRPYNDKNREIFYKKFLAKVYYRKINEIAQQQELKQLRAMNKSLKKLLSTLPR